MAERKLGSFEAVRGGMWSSGDVFQAYVSDERVVAVRTGGQMDGGKAVTAHFGLLGALVQYFLDKRVQKKRAALREANEARPLDELLLANPKNFEVRFDALDKAELRKAGILGPGKATLTLRTMGKDPVKLVLHSLDALASARRSLEPALRERLECDPRLPAIG